MDAQYTMSGMTDILRHPRRSVAGIHPYGTQDGFPITNVGNDNLRNGCPIHNVGNDEEERFRYLPKG